MKAAIIGAGSWGTALAQVISKNGNPTSLWVRRKKLANIMSQFRENSEYLPGVKISNEIFISNDLEKVVTNANLIVMAVPSQAMRQTAKNIKKFVSKNSIIVSASKGIETNSLLRMSEILKDEIPSNKDNVVVLSGPSHAEEVVLGLPTTVVVASHNSRAMKIAQNIFMNENFRVYTNNDITGVELGGALKNVIAICAGISDGLGFGDNSKAAILTRGIAEITRLGIKLGAHPATFAGLSGIGDLVVTCSSKFSRNRRAGIKIGRGMTAEEVIKSTKMVAEGINTTKAAYYLARQLKINMPITEQAFQIIFKNKDPKTAVSNLMNRREKNEIEDLLLGNIFNL